MSDERERVTAYVDGVLGEAERAEVEALIAEKPELREQLEFEQDLRARLKALPAPEPRPGFEVQVQSALRAARRRSRAYLVLPLAAALLLVLYLRGFPGFVAFEVARDHAHCFSKTSLPAKVWSDEPAEISAWFEKQGTRMPPLPAGLGPLSIVGGRYCPIGDRFAAHVYYAGRKGHLSLFVVPGPVRFEGHYEAEVRGHAVRFLRTAGATLAIVADEREAVDELAKEFAQTVARFDPAHVDVARLKVR